VDAQVGAFREVLEQQAIRVSLMPRGQGECGGGPRNTTLAFSARKAPVARWAIVFPFQPGLMIEAKLDRLARSLGDAKDVVDELTRREVKLSIDGSVHDPTDPLGPAPL
jgi:hypothetical protein